MNYLNKKRRNFIIYMVVVIVLIFAVFNTVLTFKIHNQLEKMAQNPGRWPAGAYVYDPGIGFDFSPNISGYISDSSYYVKSHKFGYRIAENDDPDTYQSGGVLSLGCSVTYGDEVITVDSSLSVDEARECLVELFPDVSSANYSEDGDGNVTFHATAGEKG